MAALKKMADIKAYFITTFTGFETIQDVIVGDFMQVADRESLKMKYPCLWVMYPMPRRPIYRNGRKNQWAVELILLKDSTYQDVDKEETNFNELEILGDKLINKLESDAKNTRDFEFDPNTDMDEWQPKQNYSADNDNGWYIPIRLTTARCHPDCEDCL